MKQVKELRATEDGELEGGCMGAVGRFGERLRVGQRITIWGGEEEDIPTLATITEIHSRIHTRSGGGASYVFIDALTTELEV